MSHIFNFSNTGYKSLCAFRCSNRRMFPESNCNHRLYLRPTLFVNQKCLMLVYEWFQRLSPNQSVRLYIFLLCLAVWKPFLICKVLAFFLLKFGTSQGFESKLGVRLVVDDLLLPGRIDITVGPSNDSVRPSLFVSGHRIFCVSCTVTEFVRVGSSGSLKK